jgi:site-specific DNA-cytosine methylase
MRVLVDLFSGIGGFHLGAKYAGFNFDKVFFSEIDRYATAVYQKRFPEAVPLGDIRSIEWKKFKESLGEAAQVFTTGGFP